jgi:hypothetical protein
MSTADDLYQQLSQANGMIEQLGNLRGPQESLAQVTALLQQAGTGRYDGELGTASAALQEFSGAMQQLGARINEHMNQTQALMNG